MGITIDAVGPCSGERSGETGLQAGQVQLEHADQSAHAPGSASKIVRSLEALTTVKRAVSADRPVSLKSGNDPRYRVTDSYLRFWLRFIEPSLPDIARGRPDLALARIRDSWPDFQGRAVGPIIRASVERLVLDDPDLGGTGVIGGFWTRSTTVEVDLVGVDRWPNARRSPSPDR